VSNGISRPSRVEINLSALRNNISFVKSWIGPKTKLMAIVKANAYGHGAVKVSQTIAEQGVDYLGVAFLEEACELQDAGITVPIVMLYPEMDERCAEAVKRGFVLTLSEIEQYHRISKLVDSERYPIKYFIKIETGMNRYGMEVEKVKEQIRAKKLRPGDRLLGFTSHLADSTMTNAVLSQKQMNDFVDIVESIKNYFGNGMDYSFEASGVIWKHRRSEGSLVRVGHLLYGLVPGGEPSQELMPIMSVKSRIAEIHDVKQGEGVGYGFAFVAKRDSRITTIPMGYADGYPWALSNKGKVIVRGKLAPIAGKVCMDAFMVDVTDIPSCVNGDEVVIQGQMGNEKIDAHQIGELAGSFSYEILSRWSRRLPRIYS
jgi:alanine racemase